MSVYSFLPIHVIQTPLLLASKKHQKYRRFSNCMYASFSRRVIADLALATSYFCLLWEHEAVTLPADSNQAQGIGQYAKEGCPAKTWMRKVVASS